MQSFRKVLNERCKEEQEREGQLLIEDLEGKKKKKLRAKMAKNLKHNLLRWNS